ncbi:MAG: lysophospholipid acyltransferase family protein [Bacteroidota bacterium]|nr:lysophospholipid acyltransferase family protein [Bacteroidota bacterium]
MHKIFSYILSPIVWLAIMAVIVILHPFQVLALKLFGYHAHKRVVDLIGALVLMPLRLIGTNYKFIRNVAIPDNRPIIVISNHQSTFDISASMVAFRKHHPKFIAKESLGKNIPSISYNLRHGGSVLIDRDKQGQSVREIIKLGRYIEKYKRTAIIYPEGTRSTTGRLREFKAAGIKTLLRSAPSAIIIPFAIDGNYKIHKYGNFPFAIGQRIRYTVLEPIEPNGLSPEEIVAKAEQEIRKTLLGDLNSELATL